MEVWRVLQRRNNDVINLLGGGAAVNVTLMTRHLLIDTSDTQEIGWNWDKKAGVLVPCCRGAGVSRCRTPEDVRRPFTAHSEAVGKYEALKAAANGRTLEAVPHCRRLEDADFPGP